VMWLEFRRVLFRSNARVAARRLWAAWYPSAQIYRPTRTYSSLSHVALHTEDAWFTFGKALARAATRKKALLLCSRKA